MVKKKIIKIGITGIDPFSGNRGVGALAYSVLFLLRKIEIDNNIKFDLTLFVNHYSALNKITIGPADVTFNSEMLFSFFGVKKFLRILTKPKLIKSLRKYFDLDFVLCMGEGDSFSDIYGCNRFDMINDQHKIARLFKKKYCILPQTIGPFTDEKILSKALKSISKAALVLPRDKQSFDFVNNKGISTKCIETIDVAFFLPFTKSKLQKDKVHVGINVSSLIWNGGYTKDNQFLLKMNYQKAIRDTINFFLNLPNVILYLVPHVLDSKPDVENDYEVSFNLVNDYNSSSLKLAPFFLTPIQAKDYISSLDFFIGARMHSTIAAFSSGVPVLPMAYSRKFNGLFMKTLSYEHVVDMRKNSNRDFMKILENTYNNRIALKQLIEAKTNSVVLERKKEIEEKLLSFFNIKK